MGLLGRRCGKCGKAVNRGELVDGLCYSCFFAAETVMDSIMDDLGIPQLMEVSAALKRLFSSKTKASVKDIVDTLLQYDNVDISVVNELIPSLPLSEQNKKIIRAEVIKEYYRRRPGTAPPS